MRSTGYSKIRDESMRLIALILMLIAPSLALSNAKFDSWTYSELPPIEVALFDNATGGCWTNIGEVQRYAEDKLRMAGADVIEQDGGDVSPAVKLRNAAMFHVHVKAERNGLGFCWGMMKIDLVIGSTVNNINGIFTYANTASTLMRNQNVNNDVLDLVGKVITRWGSNE